MKPGSLDSFIISGILGLILLMLAGCSGFITENSPIDLPTQTPTSLPTSTTVWFPPTETPTLFIAPTVQPTPNLLSDIGELILSDNFSDKTSWQVGEKPDGSVEYSTNRLTIAIQKPQGNLYSFRPSPILQNSFFEITTSTSLCRGNDTYGLLFRSSSIQDFYRLLINCNGLMRLERVRNGVVNVLVDWTISSQLSAGAPLTLRLGVWTSGNTIRVFINRVFQFEATDGAFSSGGLGVFARSAGETAVTVNFSNLQVYNLTSTAISPTVTP